MNADNHPNLRMLLRRMRYRIWCDRALVHLKFGVWIATGSLLVVASVHAFYHALPWRWGLLVSFTPLLAAVASLLLIRLPSAGTAARASDMRFKCRDLFASALEQSDVRPDSCSDVGAYLLQQADVRAKPLVGLEFRNLKSGPLLRPLLPSLGALGILLLMSPGAEDTSPSASQMKVALPAEQLRAEEVGGEPETSPLYGEIERLKARMAKTKKPPPSVQPISQAEVTKPEAPLADPANEAGQLAFTAVDTDEKTWSRAIAAPGATADIEKRTGLPSTEFASIGTDGTDAAGNSISQSSRRIDADPAPDLNSVPVDIHRRQGSSTGTSSRPFSLASAPSLPPGSDALDHPDSGAPIEIGYEMPFPPALRAYAEAYFTELRKGPSE